MLRNGDLGEIAHAASTNARLDRASPGIVQHRAISGFFSPGDHQLHKAALCIVRNRSQIPLLPLCFFFGGRRCIPPRVATVALMNAIHQKSTNVADEGAFHQVADSGIEEGTTLPYSIVGTSLLGPRCCCGWPPRCFSLL